MDEYGKSFLFGQDNVEGCLGIEIGSLLSVDIIVFLMSEYKEILIFDILLVYYVERIYQISI